jgi:hypothetical protein
VVFGYECLDVDSILSLVGADVLEHGSIARRLTTVSDSSTAYVCPLRSF